MTAMIDGICPACGHRGLLSLTRACKVQCLNNDCPDPTLVQGLLDKRDQHVHLVRFTEQGFTCQHPLVERLRPEGLFACDLGDQFRALSGPPGIGMFRIPPGGTLDDLEPVDEADVEFDMPDVPPSAEVQRQSLADAIPLGTITGIPEDASLPEGFVEVGDGSVRLPRSEYPALGDAIEAAGFDSVMIDGVEHVAIDLPITDTSNGVRYVLRAE